MRMKDIENYIGQLSGINFDDRYVRSIANDMEQVHNNKEIPKDELINASLSKIGSSILDIKEIFIDLIDLGHEIALDIEKFDDGNITKLSISVICDSVQEDITYLQTIYHTISRFIDSYKDKVMKINYKLGEEVNINCYL